MSVSRLSSYEFPEQRLDRRSVVLQLRDSIEEFIKSSGLKPGDQIPSESELSQRYGVARGSVREALKLLEQDGLIDVQHGRGRFLSATSGLIVSRPITRFESVSEMLGALGYQTTNRVLSLRVESPSQREATALQAAPGETVARLARLRLHEGQVLIYSENVFRSALLAGAQLDEQDFSGSLAAWFAERGHELVSSVADIQAVPCPQPIVKLREVDRRLPWLLITEQCVDQQGNSVLLSRDYHRGDAFTFHVLRRRAS